MPKLKNNSAKTQRQTKDKVLQARIPDDLDEELRNRARDLGLSVSTIVRNVLVNTFDLVEGVVTDSNQIARAVKGTSRKSVTPENKRSEAGSEQVLGWQEMTLNLNALCDTCNAILAKGSRACVGIPVRDRASFLCVDCLAALQSTAIDEETAKADQSGKQGK
jgi:predicted DNA-binding protein